MSDLVGTNLGKYRVVAHLGQGGMAEVYKTYQPGLDRYVAIKVMHSHLTRQSDFITRFMREATGVARLRQPNIIQVYDFDVAEGLYYMVMEFIEGPTLKAELQERKHRRKPLTLPQITPVFNALAGALDHAHAQRMIHRDRKPDNIMIIPAGQVVPISIVIQEFFAVSFWPILDLY